MYREDQKRALAALGPVLVQYFGLGEVTGTSPCCRRAAPAARTTRGARRDLRLRPAPAMQVQVQDEHGPRAAALRDGRFCVDRPGGLRGLLRQPRSQRQGVPRRLVPHRRSRPHGRGGFPLHHRAGVRHVHLRRLQRLSAGDRGEDPGASGRHRGGGRGHAGPALGRGRGRGLRRDGGGHRGGGAGVPRRQDGGLQGAEAGGFLGALPKSAYGKITKKLVREELDRLGIGAGERQSA